MAFGEMDGSYAPSEKQPKKKDVKPPKKPKEPKQPKPPKTPKPPKSPKQPKERGGFWRRRGNQPSVDVPPVPSSPFEPAPQPPIEPAPQPQSFTESSTPVSPVEYSSVSVLNILLVGSSAETMRDYVTGLFYNARDLFVQNGLAFYGENNAVDNVFSERKQRLQGLFASYGDSEYKLSAQQSAGMETFSLRLGVAGNPQQSLAVRITCAVFTQFPPVEGFDAVWIMADAEVYQTPGSDKITATPVLYAANQAGKPVLLIAGQMESFGRFSTQDDGICSITNKENKAILHSLAVSWGDEFNGKSVFPVQIYGGLTYKRKDDQGNTVLEKNSGWSYNPAACHLPLLFTIKMVHEYGRQIDSDVFGIVRHLYGRQESEWAPSVMNTEA